MQPTDKSFFQNLNSPEFSKTWAQMLAFGPVMFQVAKSMRNLGAIEHLANAQNGLTLEELGQKIDLSRYSLSVLLDGAESCGLVRTENEKFFATESALHIQNDALTKANMNFTNDVCYEGLFHLEESLRTNSPVGLKVFGKWPTIYEGLTELPPQVLQSWLEFDHFYSDSMFPRALPHVFKNGAQTVLDVGGNTGKFARACAQFQPDAKITILDYPQQLALAEEESRKAGLHDQITFQPQKLLDHTIPFPKGFDVIWMSQFLDCFGENDILSLMTRARDAMNENSVLMIMEPFIDNQKFQTSQFCLNMASLYFTCMANGHSRFYRATDFRKLLNEAGLEVTEEILLRLSHTILKCRRKN